MTTRDKVKSQRCCDAARKRLTIALSKCDRFSTNRSEWHECARLFARRNGEQTKRCLMRPG